MGIKNIELKANCYNVEHVRAVLKSHNARFIGVDHQIDTYFKVAHGRLKLREGNIENNLIHYHRPNVQGPKQADVILYKSNPESNLKDILLAAFDVLVVIDKHREIYFIENVKFHIDNVKEIGQFVEIEAIDEHDKIGVEKLKEQCNEYIDLFEISQSDMQSKSYSDLLLERKANF